MNLKRPTRFQRGSRL